jgi:hypothetical protein
METNTFQVQPKKRAGKIILGVVLGLIVVILAVWLGLTASKSLATSEYQAVFLSNGQVYFGKMTNTGNWTVLKDVYYLQVTQNLQDAASGNSNTAPTGTANNNQATQPEIKLVKLGSELHGPEDAMYIAKDKILFWENMKSDSKVMQAIRTYTNK